MGSMRASRTQRQVTHHVPRPVSASLAEPCRLPVTHIREGAALRVAQSNLPSPCPAGTLDNSPAIHRWVGEIVGPQSPEGTIEIETGNSFVPPGLAHHRRRGGPSDKSLGYSHSPLRGSRCRPLVGKSKPCRQCWTLSQHAMPHRPLPVPAPAITRRLVSPALQSSHACPTGERVSDRCHGVRPPL
jgi:hypothetical protein